MQIKLLKHLVLLLRLDKYIWFQTSNSKLTKATVLLLTLARSVPLLTEALLYK